MIQLTPDPSNPERILLTATVSLYLDRVLLSSLSAEVETAIRDQAAKDLKSSPAVRRAIAAAAQAKLLSMLGVPGAATRVSLKGDTPVVELVRPRNVIVPPATDARPASDDTSIDSPEVQAACAPRPLADDAQPDFSTNIPNAAERFARWRTGRTQQ
jgi:hypothetical protein